MSPLFYFYEEENGSFKPQINMSKTRLEAFSDGVLAIIITIMVLELKIPHGTELHDLLPLVPAFISYVLSFVFLGIYWGNHHHLVHTITQVNSGIIWGNIHLLFWLSLVPFATSWMGENNFARTTVALYGATMFMCGLAYYILQNIITKHYPGHESLKLALEKQSRKGIISQIAYFLSVPVAFIYPLISALLFVAVAVMWVIPDRNIEKALKK
jgi:uncharacterized membrane protein